MASIWLSACANRPLVSDATDVVTPGPCKVAQNWDGDPIVNDFNKTDGTDWAAPTPSWGIDLCDLPSSKKAL